MNRIEQLKGIIEGLKTAQETIKEEQSEQSKNSLRYNYLQKVLNSIGKNIKKYEDELKQLEEGEKR